MYRTALQATLQQLALIESQGSRQRVDTENARLGFALQMRQGTGIHEVWNIGSAFRHLELRLAQLNDRRKALEEQKKDLAKLRPRKVGPSTPAPVASPATAMPEVSREETGFARPQLPSARRGSVALKTVLSETEYAQRAEILAVNFLALKTEDEQLRQELQILERERNLHVSCEDKVFRLA